MVGKVVSNKMQKCITVRVITKRRHPKYLKLFKKNKSYKAACKDSSNFFIGQVVKIVSTRPLSKNIRWKVLESNPK